MKRAAALIVVAGVAAVAAGGYYLSSANAYADATDARIERELTAADFTIIRAQLAESGTDPVTAMRAMYRGPMNGELNMRYARLTAAWPQAHRRLARIPMIPDRRDPTQVLAAEVDERMGPGVFAVMQAEYARYEAEAPLRLAQRRAAAEEARRRAEALDRYIETYVREHGKFPEELPPVMP